MQGGDELRRLRLIVASLMLALVFSPALLIGHIASGQLMETAVLGGAAVMALPLLMATRSGASASVVGHGLGIILMLPSLVNGPALGGVFGPPALAFVSLPVLLTLGMGGRNGWPWCGVSILGALFLASQTVGDPDAIRSKMISLIGMSIFMTSIAYMFEVLRDRAVVDLARARDEAMAAAEAKSRFLANMSHEIRTPMNGVLGMLGVLLQSKLDEDQRSCARTAQVSGMSLLDILNDVLDFSKIDAGQLTLELAVLDLRALVEEVLGQFAVPAENKGLELVARYMPGTPIRVIGDRSRLRQVLMNLVGNAVKFTERGHVLVTVEHTESPQGPPRFTCSVLDTGIGIPRQEHAAIFEHFHQVDMSTARRHAGAGLGLAITRELVSLMEGTLALDSAEHRGSTFWFCVPLVLPHDEEVEPASEPEPEPLAALAEARLLVVDDSAVARQALREQLTPWFQHVAECASGAEALEVLREASAQGRPITLALVDQRMPGMDGLELARAIRDDAEHRGTAVVMLSAVTERISQRRLEQAGCFVHVAKPVPWAVLEAALVTALRRREASEASPSSPEVAEDETKADADLARVLVVEDNVINQKVALRILTRLGCQVDVAADGREALVFIEQSRYDIVFMDVQMPGMDGLEATREIRRRECDQDRTPIAAMTAHAMSTDRDRCLAAGMDLYISKPVHPRDLVSALRRLVPRLRAALPRADAEGSGVTSPVIDA